LCIITALNYVLYILCYIATNASSATHNANIKAPTYLQLSLNFLHHFRPNQDIIRGWLLVIETKKVYFKLNCVGFLDEYKRFKDRLCGLVVRVLGYRSGGSGSIPGTTRKKKVVGLERGPLSLVSTTEELRDRKVAASV
jgi:hypothetical protein